MIFEDEMLALDVASMLGVTESRVSQRLRRIERKVKAAMIIEEMMSCYKDDAEASQLVVDWIKI